MEGQTYEQTLLLAKAIVLAGQGIGAGLAESTGIYGLLVGIILLFVNPFLKHLEG